MAQTTHALELYIRGQWRQAYIGSYNDLLTELRAALLDGTPETDIRIVSL